MGGTQQWLNSLGTLLLSLLSLAGGQQCSLDHQKEAFALQTLHRWLIDCQKYKDNNRERLTWIYFQIIVKTTFNKDIQRTIIHPVWLQLPAEGNCCSFGYSFGGHAGAYLDISLDIPLDIRFGISWGPCRWTFGSFGYWILLRGYWNFFCNISIMYTRLWWIKFWQKKRISTGQMSQSCFRFSLHTPE